MNIFFKKKVHNEFHFFKKNHNNEVKKFSNKKVPVEGHCFALIKIENSIFVF